MSDDADFATIISSELIAEIVEEYMNKTMFKKPVKIVDLQPTETGYLFSVAYRDKVQKKTEPEKLSVQAILEHAEVAQADTQSLLHMVQTKMIQSMPDLEDETARLILEGAGSSTPNGGHHG